MALAFTLCFTSGLAFAEPDDASSSASSSTGNVLVDAGYELDNGEYTVDITMEGGSGRAFIESPTILTVEGGNPYITIVWSSDNYDYMLVGSAKYRPITTKPTSRFVVPLLAIDEPFEMTGDTTAMGTAHEITYTFTVDGATIEKVVKEPESSDNSENAENAENAGSSSEMSASSGSASASESSSAASASTGAEATSASSSSSSSTLSGTSQAGTSSSQSASSATSKGGEEDDLMRTISIVSLAIAAIAIGLIVAILRGYRQRG